MIRMTPSPDEVTQLLLDWSNGSDAALQRLTPLVYDELHRLAHRHMRRERHGHTLQTSALVNEAYLRLIDQRNVHWQSRAQFFSIASRLMRRVLVDHARAHNCDKRGGGALQVSLDEAAFASQERAMELVALDDALSRLDAIDGLAKLQFLVNNIDSLRAHSHSFASNHRGRTLCKCRKCLNVRRG